MKHKLTRAQARRMGLKAGDEVDIDPLTDMSQVHPDNRAKPYAKTVTYRGKVRARRFHLGRDDG